MINPSRVAFNIFGKDIYWYAICVSLGMILGIFFAINASKKYRWKEDDIIDFCLLAIPSGIIGARLYYVLFEFKMYAENPISVFYIWEGGLAILGGVIAGFIAGVVFCKVRKRSFLELMDICAPSLAIGQAVGRWGNFFNQEAFGSVVTNVSFMWFPLAVRIDATNTIHYALFFYESIWCLLIAVYLITFRKRFKHSGDVGLSYLMLYGFERMIVENFREDSLFIGQFRVSQLISAVLFFGIAAFFIIRSINEKNKPLIITNKANPAYDWGEIKSDTEPELVKEIDEDSEVDEGEKSNFEKGEIVSIQSNDEDMKEINVQDDSQKSTADDQGHDDTK